MVKYLLLLLLMLTPLANAAYTPPSLDAYGGLNDVACTNTTGMFTITTVNNHKVYCTPAGHVYYFKSLYTLDLNLLTTVDENGHGFDYYALQRYGTAANWGTKTVAMLQTFGINGVGPYGNLAYVGPMNSVQIPYIIYGNIGYYSMLNSGGHGCPVKDLYYSMGQSGNTSTWGGFRNGNGMIDFEDPCYSTYYAGMLADDYYFQSIAALSTSLKKYAIGFNDLDADNAHGLIGGPDFTAQSGNNDFRRGYASFFTSPLNYANSQWGVIYTDGKVYEKNRWRTLLETKYSTIAALNTAWGSSYTTFGSSGYCAGTTIIDCATSGAAESLGTGNASTTTFTATAAHTTISKFSVYIKVGSNIVGGDTGTGTIYGVGGTGCGTLSGTVNYSTGAISVTCGTAPGSGAAITFGYVANGWGSGTGFLDEDCRSGHSSYCGDGTGNTTIYLTGLSSTVKADIGMLTQDVAHSYATTGKTNVDAWATASGFPGPILYMGSSANSSWGVPPDRYTLAGLKDVIDVFTAGLGGPGYSTWTQDMLDFVHTYAGDMPIIHSSYRTANPQSSLAWVGSSCTHTGTSVTCTVATPNKFSGMAGGFHIETSCDNTDFNVAQIGFTATSTSVTYTKSPAPTHSTATCSVTYGDGGDWATQSAKGSSFQTDAEAAFSAQYTADGIYPYVGYLIWGAQDNWAEALNWGLLTVKNNPYNGVDDTSSSQPCSYDATVTCGGENSVHGTNLGDSISGVTAANTTIDTGLLALAVVPPTAPGAVAGALVGATAPSYVSGQNYLNATAATSFTTSTFDSTGANLLVVFLGSHNHTTLTVSDSKGNTWLPLAGPTHKVGNASYPMEGQSFYAINPTVGTGHTITVTLSQAEPLVVSVSAFSGANVYSPIDGYTPINGDQGMLSKNVSSLSLTTTQPNDTLLGIVKGYSTNTFTAGSGFTGQASSSGTNFAAATKTASSAGAFQASFTASNSDFWQSALVAVAPTKTKVTLSWSASSTTGTLANYYIERCSGAACSSFSQIGSVAGNVLTYDDTTISAGTVYRYQIRSEDTLSQYSSYSTPITVSPLSPHVVPNFSVTSARVLSWSAPSYSGGAISMYLIERCVGSGCTGFSQIGTTASTSYFDSAATPGAVYNYRVRAQDTDGQKGPYSSVVQVSVPAYLDNAGGGSDNGGTTSSLTYSYTVGSSTNRLLVVGVSDATADAVTGVTYSGTAMTLIAKVQAGSAWNYLYYLLNPASGAHSVVVSASSTGYLTSTASSWYNIAQSSQPDAHASATVASGTAVNLGLSASQKNTIVVESVWGPQGLFPGAGSSKLVSDSSLDSLGMFSSNPSPVTTAYPITLKNDFGGQDQASAIIASFALAVQPGSPSVTFDNSADGGNNGGSTTSLTYSFTVGTGTDRLLLVNVVTDTTSGDIASITYGGQAMTLIGSVQSAVDNNWQYLYYLLNPPSGANNVVITSGSSHWLTSQAASWYNVHQAAPEVSTTNTAAAGVTSLTTSVTTASDSALVVQGVWLYSHATPSGDSVPVIVDSTFNAAGMFVSGGSALAPTGSVGMTTLSDGALSSGSIMASFAQAPPVVIPAWPATVSPASPGAVNLGITGKHPSWCWSNCPSGKEIVYHAPRGDGSGRYDLWTISAGLTGAACRTCTGSYLNTQLSDKTSGNAEWCPNGDCVIFQAQSSTSALTATQASPGTGLDDYLGAVNTDFASGFKVLDKDPDATGGFLQPRISRNGNWLIVGHHIAQGGKSTGVFGIASYLRVYSVTYPSGVITLSGAGISGFTSPITFSSFSGTAPTGNQTCVLTASNGTTSSGAVAYGVMKAVSGSFSGQTARLIFAGNGYSTVPTTWTVSGTNCGSGTVTTTGGSLGGADFKVPNSSADYFVEGADFSSDSHWAYFSTIGATTKAVHQYRMDLTAAFPATTIALVSPGGEEWSEASRINPAGDLQCYTSSRFTGFVAPDSIGPVHLDLVCQSIDGSSVWPVTFFNRADNASWHIVSANPIETQVFSFAPNGNGIIANITDGIFDGLFWIPLQYPKIIPFGNVQSFGKVAQH